MAMQPGAGGTGRGRFVFPLSTGIVSSQGMMPVQQQSARYPMIPVMQQNVQNMMAVGYNPQIPQAAMAMQGGLSMGTMQNTSMTFMGQTGYLAMRSPTPQYTHKQLVEEQQKIIEQQHKMLEEERKRRQFEEQKQKLRLLSNVKHKTSEKHKDDAMEAIKGNLDGFSRDAKMHPAPVLHTRKPVGVRMFSGTDTNEPMLPSWIYNDSLVPDLYKNILEMTLSTSGIDTAKLYPILLSSGLPRETLGQIWAMANQTTPGKLTKEELYIVLAMIGIAQRGECAQNTDILNQFTSAPIPTFSNFPVTFPITMDQRHVGSPMSAVSKPVDVSQTTVALKIASSALGDVTQPGFLTSSFTQALYKSEDDDFQDFQDASKSGPIEDSFSDFQSGTSKSTSSLLPNSLANERHRKKGGEEESSSDEDSCEESEDDDENKDTDDEEEAAEDVNEVFRKQLMDALQAGKSVQGEDSDNDLDDEAMMALDENLSALFAEQQKRIQAKKDAKAKIREEKILRKNFKIKVLDLIEVFVKKHSESPLVFSIIEPLISVIEQSMNAESSQLDEDFLHKAADIFMNNLCKCKRFCKDVSELKDELHDMIERLIKRACKQSDSSVALYCFSASLFLFKVLKAGATTQPEGEDQNNRSEDTSSQANILGFLDLERVTTLYQESLQEFMTKRNSPLTAAMFLDLFNRFPFICKPLLGIIIKSIKDGARQHQQAQACTLVMKAIQNTNLKKTLSQTEWKDLIRDCVTQIASTLQNMEELKVKVDKEKVLKCFELLAFLIKIINQQKLDINLTELPPVLQTLHQKEGFGTTRLDDVYWNVMMLLGYKRPKKEQTKVAIEVAPENSVSKKKKGFLPESKKRKNRKKAKPEEGQKNFGTENTISKGQQQPDVTSKKKRKKKNKRKSGEQEGGAQEIFTLAPASKKVKPNSEPQNRAGNAAAIENSKKKQKKANKKAKSAIHN